MAISAVLRANRLLRITAIVMACALAVLSAVNSSAGIQGSGLKSFAAIGVVSSVGAGVTAGGATYATSGATFRIDGQPGNKQQLRNGQVVSIVGTDDGQLSASEVIFNGNVRGAVSGIDTQSGTFAVLGQTVHVDSKTIFGGIEPPGPAGLHSGEVVEVSAFANSAGELVASRIDAGGSGSAARITGSVQALDAARQTFRINSLTVNYQNAAVGGVLADGVDVVVQGADVVPGGALIANQVDVSQRLNNQPGFDGRLQGLITTLSSSSYFEVEGQPVTVDAHTKLHLKTPLGLDVAVEVTGTFDANGVLVASKVKSSK